MALKNLTPHAINLLDAENKLIMTIESHGIARVEVVREKLCDMFFEHDLKTVEVPINRSKFGKVEGLPEYDGSTMYIVSMIVAKACPDRDDLICPDDTVRDDKGRIIGCKAFCKV